LFNSFVNCQIENDSIKLYTPIKLNSIITNWSIINSQLFFYPKNILQTEQLNSKSLYSLYIDSQINFGLNITLQSNVLLNQFKIAQHWETQKKYGVFTKYLGTAQFVGVMGLSVIHFSKFNMPPKGKAIFNNDKIKNP